MFGDIISRSSLRVEFPKFDHQFFLINKLRAPDSTISSFDTTCTLIQRIHVHRVKTLVKFTRMHSDVFVHVYGRMPPRWYVNVRCVPLHSTSTVAPTQVSSLPPHSFYFPGHILPHKICIRSMNREYTRMRRVIQSPPLRYIWILAWRVREYPETFPTFRLKSALATEFHAPRVLLRNVSGKSQ